MKKLYSQILLGVMIAAGFSSCRKDDMVEVQTLSVLGQEFYYGEKVPVWAGTQGDLAKITYDWKCSAGSFDSWQTQHLYENLWIAPTKAGDYTVTVTANNGKTSNSRTTAMKVTRYFFDEFQNNYTFNGAGWAQSNTTQVMVDMDKSADQARIELTSNGTSGPNMRRTLSDADLKIPFSIATTLGWKGFYRAGQFMYISLYFRQPDANKSYPYIREIRWEFMPNANPATTDNYQIRYETFVPATNTSKFSTTATAVLPAPQLLFPTGIKGKNPNLAFADNVERKLSMSIDANNIFYAYIDGQLWFQSDGIKRWLADAKTRYPGFEDPIGKEYRVTFPAKANATETSSTIFLNSVYINDDGTILK